MGKLKNFFKNLTTEEPFQYDNYYNIDFSVDLKACEDMSKEELLQLVRKEESEKRTLLKDFEMVTRTLRKVSDQRFLIASVGGLSVTLPQLFSHFSFGGLCVSLLLGLFFGALILFFNMAANSPFNHRNVKDVLVYAYYLLLYILFPLIVYAVFNFFPDH